MIIAVVNGEKISLEVNTALDVFLDTLKLGETRVAVEVNQEIIPKSQYGHYTIQSHDKIEIVTAIGGG